MNHFTIHNSQAITIYKRVGNASKTQNTKNVICISIYKKGTYSYKKIIEFSSNVNNWKSNSSIQQLTKVILNSSDNKEGANIVLNVSLVRAQKKHFLHA